MPRCQTRAVCPILAVALGCWSVLSPFSSAILWAAILAYASWPLYRRLRAPFGRYTTFAAGSMTLLITCLVILPLLWLGTLITHELTLAYRNLPAFLAQTSHSLPAFLGDIPWLGEQLQRALDRFAADPSTLGGEALKWVQAWSSELAGVFSGIGRNLAKLVMTLLTVFFFYRDGDSIVRDGRRVVARFFASRLDPYLQTAAAMTRAVVYGLSVTAFAQGLIAGFGYAILGIEGAALLGALTGALSTIPVVGTGAVWGSIALYLLATGQLGKGIALLLWGAVLVHPTDNVLRPLLISNATHVPFLLVMFGVVGGLAAFGLVGIFLGPVLLAIGLAVWREWAADDPPCTQAHGPAQPNEVGC